MSGAQSISTRRAYGVQRVCRVWARPRSSVLLDHVHRRRPAEPRQQHLSAATYIA